MAELFRGALIRANHAAAICLGVESLGRAQAGLLNRRVAGALGELAIPLSQFPSPAWRGERDRFL